MSKNKYVPIIGGLFLIGINFCLCLLIFWKINTWAISQNREKEKLENQDNNLSDLTDTEVKKPSSSVSTTEIRKDSFKIHEEENTDLKSRSSQFSPSGEKVAYYQNKFVNDIKEIGDPDYTSLIVEQSDKKETVFQSNFHISYFEWLNDNEIKVYKGCGSNCLLSYVVNVHSKKYKEIIE